MESAESGPKIVYWGKPRRGMAMLRERDWIDDVALLKGSGDNMPCFCVLWIRLFVALDDASVDADARRTVDDWRDDLTAREAKAPKFLEAIEDENIMVWLVVLV